MLMSFREQKELLLGYDLQFFANDEGGEKTEEPTAKKIEDSSPKLQKFQLFCDFYEKTCQNSLFSICFEVKT